ncbi:hypothetical protein ABZ671_17165 [Micromonospora sp. NPDC006766]|uniref:hypothetical protein n=1 Tax=Micromonospora sp. NPDC006766 TaxID=3154778 RepID=UPI00340AB330
MPTPLADAAGITAGPVVVLRGEQPGELLVSTRDAALARVRAALGTTGGPPGVVPRPLLPALVALGRTAPGPAAGGRVDLPDDGPIVCDTAPLLALLDGTPAGEALVPLLPRVLITDWVRHELFRTLLAAGLTTTAADAPPEVRAGRPDRHDHMMDTLAALGLRIAYLTDEWAPVNTLEFALRAVDGLTDAERATLALATHHGVPALLGRPIGELPAAAAGVTVVDYRDLAPAPAADDPLLATPA